jgi:hypothetical protein
LLHPAFLLLCNLMRTLVLWLRVVEEVFSGVIDGHKTQGVHNTMWELACVGAGLLAKAAGQSKQL